MPRLTQVLIDGPKELELTYLVPEELAANVIPGSRVSVPLRGRRKTGTVLTVDESDRPDRRLLPVERVIGEDSAIPPGLLELGRWISSYYNAPLEAVMRSLLPGAVREDVHAARTQKVIAVERELSAEETAAMGKRAPVQAEILARVVEAGEPVALSELTRFRKGAPAAVRSLIEKGVLRSGEGEVRRDPYRSETFVATEPHALNREQEEAFRLVLRAIAAPESARPVLIHGVTGSGKTEIYLQAIQRVLDQGRSALVLVPEISLTPQTVERFKSRFAHMQDQVAVLHSHLSQGERFDEWHRIRAGKARIAIGARSAVFAPLRDLGLVVVDEEHEGTYKQENPPRYHARDVAVVRAKLEKCAIVLGSATPSLESYHNSVREKYTLVHLRERVDDQTLPLMRIVDMRREPRKSRGAPSILSERLRQAVSGRLEKGEQVILFLNRRGFARALVCQACGHACQCRHCSVALTYHQTNDKLLCHICGFQQVPPRLCPECRDPSIRHAGYGTQKAAEVVEAVFPEARVARIDTDSMARKNALRTTLADFQAGRIDILLGTQMIAKGLHFPNVTLVGILNADLGLHVPDFRAGERTFQLLTQVAGRAGRGEMQGEVFVQTFVPHSPSIQFARHHDFEGFAEQELEFRRQFHYPPFLHAVLVTARSEHEGRARLTLQTFARRLGEGLPESILAGEPLPSPIEKSHGRYRFQLLLRAPAAGAVVRRIQSVIKGLTLPEDVVLFADVDPYRML